jgi:hypothetical protein
MDLEGYMLRRYGDSTITPGELLDLVPWKVREPNALMAWG